jgi:prevent-host-death family protein
LTGEGSNSIVDVPNVHIVTMEAKMGNITAANARGNLADVINTVAYAKERIVLTRRGKRVAAVIPIEDLDVLERIEDEIDLSAARTALADTKKHGTIPWEKIKKELGL